MIIASGSSGNGSVPNDLTAQEKFDLLYLAAATVCCLLGSGLAVATFGPALSISFLLPPLFAGAIIGSVFGFAKGVMDSPKSLDWDKIDKNVLLFTAYGMFLGLFVGTFSFFDPVMNKAPTQQVAQFLSNSVS